MPDWKFLGSLLGFASAYYTTLLVRCAVFSLGLIAAVMLLRRIFSRWIFLRGGLWAAFLVVPFLGRLRIFYENEAVLSATWKMTAVTASRFWVDDLYMARLIQIDVRFLPSFAGIYQSVFLP